jgi:hypothetical protein
MANTTIDHIIFLIQLGFTLESAVDFVNMVVYFNAIIVPMITTKMPPKAIASNLA